MTVRISLPQADDAQDQYTRERMLAAQRELYDWDRRPGCFHSARASRPQSGSVVLSTTEEMLDDAAGSILSGAMSLIAWARGKPTKLSHYDSFYSWRAPAEP